MRSELKRSNKWKKVFYRYGCTLLCLCFVFIVSPVFAAAEKTSSKVVRVGAPEDIYDRVNEKGERIGYGYEYLQKIANYTDWTYEYVPCT